jgi:Protein of unknown function (DUF3810)
MKIKIIALALLLLLQWLFFAYFASALQPLARYCFEAQQSMFGFLSAIPFSVGDGLYLILGGLLLRFVWQMLRQKSAQKLVLLLLIGNFALAYYQLSWGLMYQQTPIACSKTPENTSLADVVKLAQKYTQLSAESRRAYGPSAQFVLADIQPICADILQAQQRLPKALQKTPIKGHVWQSSLFSGLMNYTGILGYFNPFTHQAQYNGQAPHSGLPFTLGHEFAHAMGYAREQEANYIAFKMSQNSTQLAYRYAGQLYALKSLLGICKQQDESQFEALKQNLDPLVWQDILNEKAFYEAHQSWITDAFMAMNDWFLKSNQQAGSVTYSYFVYLLLSDELGQK